MIHPIWMITVAFRGIGPEHPFGGRPHQDTSQAIDGICSVLAVIGIDHVYLGLVVAEFVFHAGLRVIVLRIPDICPGWDRSALFR